VYLDDEKKVAIEADVIPSRKNTVVSKPVETEDNNYTLSEINFASEMIWKFEVPWKI
jgi:hypothetical protein